jgi:hypothetical protein
LLSFPLFSPFMSPVEHLQWQLCYPLT